MTCTKRSAWVAVGILVATVAQLALAVLAPNLPQFSGKAFGARLVAYPLLMCLVPAIWFCRHRRSPGPAPWLAFALVMLPFLIDVSGNTLDLYDRVVWFDDLCHFLNWLLLLSGLGLLLDADRRAPRGLLALAIAGAGALLAIVWEVGEWATFIRFGKELETAYADTLGDLVLGTLGGCLAAALVSLRRPRPRF